MLKKKTCDYFSIDDAPVTFCELQDAVNSLNSEHHTIKLLKDFEGAGVIVDGKDVKFDFNQHTFKASGTLAGSTGTKSQIFQLLKGSTVSMHNGTLTSDTAKMYIQNYSDLTLNNMTLDASGKSQVTYVVSNNYGSLDVQNDTAIIAAEGAVAFDLWYGSKDFYEEGVTVNFGLEFTGFVKGNIEYGRSSAFSAMHADDWEDITELNIRNGEFDVEFKEGSAGALDNANIKIYDGIFTKNPEKFVAKGHYVDEIEDAYVVYQVNSDLPDDINVKIDATSGDAISEGTKEGLLVQLEGSDLENLNIAKVVNIELFSEFGLQMTDTITPYSFHIPVDFPELAEGYTRKYYVVRYHLPSPIDELVVDSWEVEYEDGEVVIESNLFSQFTIGYIDTKEVKAPDTGKGAVSAAATSSVAAAIVASTLVSTAYAVSRAKRQ